MKVENRSSKGYIPFKDVVDIRFDRCQLYKDPSTEDYYVKSSRLFQKESNAKAAVKDIEKRMKTPNIYYVPPTDFDFKSANQFCSNMTRVNVYTPYPEVDLDRELNQRIHD